MGKLIKGKLEKLTLEDGTYDFENYKIAKHLRDARRLYGTKYDFDEIIKLNEQGYFFTFFVNGEVHWEKDHYPEYVVLP